MLVLFSGVYVFGDRLGVGRGLVICRSDCTDYDNLSQYVADNRAIYSGEVAARIIVGRDPHRGLFYKGFALYIGVHKIMFGDRWAFSYVMVNALLVAAGTALVTWAVLGYWRVQPFTAATLVFICGNLIALKFVKYLLPDFLFAFLALSAFALAARGIVARDRKVLIVSVLVASVSVFVRPNGLFIWILVVGTILVVTSIPARYRYLTYAVPIVIGSLGLLTVWLVSPLPKREGFKQGLDSIGLGPLHNSFSQLARFNLYSGENLYYTASLPVQIKPHLGSVIVNTPYHESISHNGDFRGMALASLLRFTKLFELQYYDQSYHDRGVNPLFDTETSGYKKLLNLYRLTYYAVLYILAIAGVILLIRRREANQVGIALLSLYVGYLLIFIGISWIEVRYRLSIDLIAVVLAAFAVHSFFSTAPANRLREWLHRPNLLSRVS